jgi:hypothetical protein
MLDRQRSSRQSQVDFAGQAAGEIGLRCGQTLRAVVVAGDGEGDAGLRS